MKSSLYGTLFLLTSLSLGCGLPTGDDDDDSGPAHHDQAIQLVGFGDSVTDGYCAYTGYGYFDLLADNKPDYPDYAKRDLRYHYGEVHLNNAAISGTTSCNYTPSAIRNAIRAQTVPDADESAVVITLGGNDLIHDYGCGNPRECSAYCSTYNQARPWADNYKARMQSFIDVFKSELPNAKIFLANIYDPTDGVGDIENAPVPLPPWPDGEQILAMYNSKIWEIADEDPDVTLVDMHGTMYGHGIHFDDPTHPNYDKDDPSYWYCYNLEDPNERGYHEIRKTFWNHLASTYTLE